ncbi:PstS family phosphate ABC transporter substrate-binding protein [Sphingobacterium cellulitidis]|uniref:Phosphate ABC transporter substrate-binding protein n=1 Tax=Sphingobacterium cellulitidis TaxID=1768011 RepID=A0A8H9KXI4_9SPHI|nr:substrate-binding domain-containing protein [Sphingobacterium soli]MBA8988660.1 phosphate transport system substrate-binding protein [Sphingobacterium soli]GGE34595.1 phosphate ABC transporter substrate-binding protein [Sphingobacterium soli]
MKRILIYAFIGFLMLSNGACSNSKKKGQDVTDSTQKKQGVGTGKILAGELAVIVDESILPIMLEQADVFKTSYENANIRLIPLPEKEAINALITGEADIAVLARSLSTEESAGFVKRQLKPRTFPIFYDGVLFFNNLSAADTSIDINTLKSLLKGESNSGKRLVFDNINSTNFRKVKELTNLEKVSGQSVKGMKTSKEVIDEVLADPNSIGVISYGQYLDCIKQFGEENKIRILSLQSIKDGKSLGFFKPSQTTFATDEYALKSEFQVLNYQPKMGLGIGFSAFMTGDRGQRIVLKYGLLPYTMPGREIIIREDNIN